MKLWDNWETRCDIVGVLQEFSRFINRFNLTIRTSVDIKDPVRSVCSQENDLKGERLGLAWVRGSCFLRFYYSLKIDLSVSCFMLCIFHPAACCPHLVTACLCLWNTQSVHGGKTNQNPPQMCDFFVNETKFFVSLHAVCQPRVIPPTVQWYQWIKFTLQMILLTRELVFTS